MSQPTVILQNTGALENYIITPLASAKNKLTGVFSYFKAEMIRPVGAALATAIIAHQYFYPDDEQESLLKLGVYGVGLLTFAISNRDVILRKLSRKVWVYYPRSLTSKMQFAVKLLLAPERRLLSNHTFAEKHELPDLPIPNLKLTLQRFIGTIEPILSKEEFLNSSRDVRSFSKSKTAFYLQLGLENYASKKRNWLKEPWSQLAYQKNRTPLNLSSSWYGLDGVIPRKIEGSPYPDAVRATYSLSSMQYYAMAIREGRLPYESTKPIPVCMDQYKNLFGTVRIPRKEMDLLETYSDSNYVVVFERGVYFYFPLFRDQNPISEIEIYERLVQIKNETIDEENLPVNHLTMLERDSWAEIRDLVRLDPVNKRSMELIERSMMVVVFMPDHKETLNQQAKEALCGTLGRWIDKMNLIFDSQGVISALVEHSHTDASIQAAFLQESLIREEKRFEEDKGSIIITPPKGSFIKDVDITPIKLHWNLSKHKTEIQRALRSFNDTSADIEIDVMEFCDYGKGWIKQQRLNPDSWFQMALQLAYFRLVETHVLTYESVSTRLYAYGRTATARSGSRESALFVNAMESDKPSKDKIGFLKDAINVHVRRKHEAMVGEGVDRHILGLRMVDSFMNKKNSIFDTPAFKLRFTLATSQVPFKKGPGNGQGGGFLPIWDLKEGKIPDSAGVSYSMKEDKIYSHNTTFISAIKTEGFNAVNLSRALTQSLRDMQALFQ